MKKQYKIVFIYPVEGQRETIESTENVTFADGGIWINYPLQNIRFFTPHANIANIIEFETKVEEKKK